MRLPRIPLLSRLAMVTLLVGASGCLATAQAPVYPTPIRLASSSPFTLYAMSASTQTLNAHCAATRIDGNVLSVVGDTLLLSDVRVVEARRGASRCEVTDSLRVLVSRDPTVRAEMDYTNGAASGFAVALSALALVVTVLRYCYYRCQ